MLQQERECSFSGSGCVAAGQVQAEAGRLALKLMLRPRNTHFVQNKLCERTTKDEKFVDLRDLLMNHL